MFNLNIEMNNDAFVDNRSGEVARILRALADKFEKDECIVDFSILKDINGNTVGSAYLS